MNDGYSICLNEWALDGDIKNELGLLLIISSLCAEKGYCYASNDYLADLFNTTEVSISRKLKKIANKNYINIEYERRGSQVISRKIRLTKMLTDRYQNCYPTVNKNVKENNINLKNTSINNILIVEQAINYMNELAGTSFKYQSKKTQSLINARLKEGFDLEDLKDVIYYKYHEWFERPFKFKNGITSDTYYRPNTLFSTNFESYLEQYKRDYK